MRFPTLLILLISLILLPNCQKGRDEKSIPKILAAINGDSITSEEFLEAFKDIETGLGNDVKMGEGRLRELKKEVLDQLIERKIFLLEAHRTGIKVGEEEIRKTSEGVKADYPPDGFEKMLDEKGMSYADWEKEMMEDLMIMKLHEKIQETPLDISEEELRKYYNEHVQEFNKKDEVHVRQIVVATEEEATQIRQALLSGTDFSQLARERSLSPDREKGGDLGFFSKGMMPKEFDIVFSLKIGEVSNAIKTPYGYHIFKVEGKKPARRLSYQEAKTQVRNIIIQEKKEVLFRLWVEDLKKKFNIKINYQLLYEEDKVE